MKMKNSSLWQDQTWWKHKTHEMTCEHKKTHFYCQGGQMVIQVVWRGCGVSILRGHQTLTWTEPWAASSSGLFWPQSYCVLWWERNEIWMGVGRQESIQIEWWNEEKYEGQVQVWCTVAAECEMLVVHSLIVTGWYFQSFITLGTLEMVTLVPHTRAIYI